MAQVAPALQDIARERLDLAVAVQAIDAGEGAGRLATIVGDLLIRRLQAGPGAWRSVGGERAGTDMLLDLKLQRRGSRLVLEGTLRPTDRVLWEEALGRSQGLLAHVFAEVAVDREVRTLLGPHSDVRGLAILGVDRPPGAVVAAASMDLDGDEKDELIVTSLDAVRVWSLEGNRFVEGQSLSLAAVPSGRWVSRDPVAFVVPLARRKALLLWTGRFATTEWLGIEAGALHIGDGPLVPGAPLLAGADGRVLVGKPARGEPSFDAIGWWSPDAPAAPVTSLGRRAGSAAIDLGAGAVAILGSDGTLAASADQAWTGVGAGITACDLDGDGEAEIIASDASDPDQPDAVKVLGASGAEVLWASLRIPEPVYTVACGDWDGDGRLEAIALPLPDSSRAWLVRPR